MQHCFDSLHVQWVVADFGFDAELGHWFANKTKPTASQLTVYEAYPKHTIELFNIYVKLKRQVDNRADVCSNLQ